MINQQVVQICYMTLTVVMIVFATVLPFFKQVGKAMVIQYYGFLVFSMIVFVGIYFAYCPQLDIKTIHEIIFQLLIWWTAFLFFILVSPMVNAGLNLMTGHKDLNKGKEKEFYFGFVKFGLIPFSPCFIIATLFW